MAGSGSGYMRGLGDEEEAQVSVKEEETGQHSRSFAIFDSPSKLRFAQKSPQFYDKHVGLILYYLLHSIQLQRLAVKNSHKIHKEIDDTIKTRSKIY